MKVEAQLKKWARHLDRWGHPSSLSFYGNNGEGAGVGPEEPQLYLQRDARTLLGDERNLVSQAFMNNIVLG